MCNDVSNCYTRRSNPLHYSVASTASRPFRQWAVMHTHTDSLVLCCSPSLLILCCSPSLAPVWQAGCPASLLLPGASLTGVKSHVGSFCGCPAHAPLLALKGPEQHPPSCLIAAACCFRNLRSCDITAAVAHACWRPEVSMLCTVDPAAFMPAIRVVPCRFRRLSAASDTLKDLPGSATVNHLALDQLSAKTVENRAQRVQFTSSVVCRVACLSENEQKLGTPGVFRG